MQKNQGVVGVVTTPEAPRGRGLHPLPNCIENYARSEGYPVFTPENLKDEGIISRLTLLKPDMLLIASYGKYLPKKMLEVAPLQVNIHPSLLPKYRGPNPILAPLLNGDKESGVSFMHVTSKMDAGEIYKQKTFPLEPRMTGGDLEKKLIQVGLGLLEEFFRELREKEVQMIPQNDDQATYTAKTKKEDTRISWKDSALSIDRKVRAYNPRPRAFFNFREKKVFVETGELLSVEGNSVEPRIESVDREEGSINLLLSPGLYALKQVTPKGKKSMRAYDFIQGYRLKVGESFQ